MFPHSLWIALSVFSIQLRNIMLAMPFCLTNKENKTVYCQFWQTLGASFDNLIQFLHQSRLLKCPPWEYEVALSHCVCVATHANINSSLMAENWAYTELSSTPLGPQITNHLMLKAAASSAAGMKGQTHVRSELLLTQDTSLPTCLWSSRGPHQEREESSRGEEWNNFISCTVMLPLKSACEECAPGLGEREGSNKPGKKDNGNIGPALMKDLR